MLFGRPPPVPCTTGRASAKSSVLVPVPNVIRRVVACRAEQDLSAEGSNSWKVGSEQLKEIHHLDIAPGSLAVRRSPSPTSSYDAESMDNLGWGLQNHVRQRASQNSPEQAEILEAAFKSSPDRSSHAIHSIGTPLNAGDGSSPVVTPKYQTIMLKVSGEALQGNQGFGLDPEVLQAFASEVAEAHKYGIRIAIVVGGGNYFRGASAWKGLDRATADYVGMLATVMNALCLQGALENLGVETRVQTAIEMREVAEPYIRRRAISHLKAGRVLIFGAGTGNPFFTTDTAAALRAAEVNAEVFLKATKVDGVYDSDPAKNPHARRYDTLSYRQVAMDSLRVMDETAVTLCKENAIPVIVFNIMEKGNILKAALGQAVGTVVCETTEPATATPFLQTWQQQQQQV